MSRLLRNRDAATFAKQMLGMTEKSVCTANPFDEVESKWASVILATSASQMLFFYLEIVVTRRLTASK